MFLGQQASIKWPIFARLVRMVSESYKHGTLGLSFCPKAGQSRVLE